MDTNNQTTSADGQQSGAAARRPSQSLRKPSAVSLIAVGVAALTVIAAYLGYFPVRGQASLHMAGTDDAAQKPQPDGAQSVATGHMALEKQFTGPLKDTVVQRWTDPSNGATCYIYLPVIVQHEPALPNGMVHYGANNIGSISCFGAR